MEYDLTLNFRFVDADQHKKAIELFRDIWHEKISSDGELLKTLLDLNPKAADVIKETIKNDIFEKYFYIENVLANDKKISIRQTTGSSVEEYVELIADLIIALGGKFLSSKAEGDEELIKFKCVNNAISMEYIDECEE